MPETRSRIYPSSSTTRISDAINNPFLLIFTSFDVLGFLPLGFLRERECEGHFRALPVLGIAQSDLSPMVFHDLAYDRQPQAGALGAGGDIRLGQPVAMFRRQADAIVGNA